jgi:ferredoxin
MEHAMKLHLDATLCQGYGLCQEQAPGLLELDEWGYAALRTPQPDLGSGARAAADAAVRVCPARALRLG